MSDKVKNTSQINEILQSSALIQRLDKRRSQPIGLINTRQSPSSSSGLPATIVQRFGWLEQIQTRYGVSNNSTQTGTELTFASPSSKSTGEQTNTFTSEASIAQPRTSTTTTQSSASSQAPNAKFRISRKVVPFGSESLPSKSNEIPLQIDTSTSPQATNTSPLIMRKATSETLETEIPQQPILRDKPLENKIQSSTQAFSSAKAEANIPLVMRKATTISQNSSPQNPMVSAKGSQQTSLKRDLPTEISGPLVKSQSSSLIVQRQPETNIPLVMRKATTENLEEESQQQPEQLAVAKEISSSITSKPQSTMILRQSSQVAVVGNNFSETSKGGTNNSLPLAITPLTHNGQIITRQTSPVNMSKTVPMSSTTMSMSRPASMPIPESNVAEIAEQVSRLLCHQLTVERERRGMRK